MMPKNILIIGAGPAGEAAATTLRKLDKSATITLIEKERAGGLCLNKGCIPSKTLLERVHTASQNGEKIDWDEIQARKNDVVNGIRTSLETRLQKEKITLIQGTAQFHDADSVDALINGKNENIPFDVAILATGTEIFYPKPLDDHKQDILNSDSLLQIKTTPASVAVVGGGAVGCEFACLLHAAGSKVTIIEMQETLLPGEDALIANTLANNYEKRGIAVKTATTVQQLQKNAHGWTLQLSQGDPLNVDVVLSCVGRIPVLDGLHLDKANVTFTGNKIQLNNFRQTSNPKIYVAGDAGGTRLAHHAAAQAEAIAHTIMGTPTECDNQWVPRCLYSWPEVASVGQWKYQREEKNLPVKTSRAFFKGSAKALAANETEGFVQIVSDPETGKLCGAQIIGSHATELIHIFSVALKANLTVQDLSSVMFAHPTLAELIKEAAKK